MTTYRPAMTQHAETYRERRIAERNRGKARQAARARKYAEQGR